ncbi:hypothetical protein [Paludisphaera rhizosphaerae]|uniref:hypothetical protein n=1 Tax=Paludisphaera rhizosphaerae TaxID=2711216 RepID=UPI0013EA2E0E|nr:hypothetical protein [Paludisphaera rhizosphaerae]
MAINLPPEIEESIQAAVRDGRFRSVDEAVAAAWRSYRRRQVKRTKREAKASITPEELNQRLLAEGLISRLPDPAADVDDDDDPIVVEGEPLSETILRERR